MIKLSKLWLRPYLFKKTHGYCIIYSYIYILYKSQKKYINCIYVKKIT